ncbi:MAG: dTMP kinase [Eubacteriales bacterium]|nr:dTMP kinase [Eubacteriales bacterium]
MSSISTVPPITTVNSKTSCQKEILRKMENKADKKGRFIVFEGLDGSGKTTQIDILSERLRSEGRKIYKTAEPTESVTGGLLRDALGGISKRSACEMAALFVIDRIFHNVNHKSGIMKMLNDGYDVICDRYYYSSLAYQGSETDFSWVRGMNLDCPEIMRPDICIFLDISPRECVKRIGKDRAVTEIYEKEEKLTRFRKQYFEVFELLKDTDNIVTVGADGTINETAEKIYAAVKSI